MILLVFLQIMEGVIMEEVTRLLAEVAADIDQDKVNIPCLILKTHYETFI
jgi:hypothetical protein